MATWSEALRRVYSDLVKRRARVRVSAPVDPLLNEPPIFVIGLYRSGTTLLRYVLDSHSRIACPPESAFLAALRPLIDDERSSSGLDSLGFDRAHVLQRIRHFAAYFFEGYAASKGKARWADKTPLYVDHLGFLTELFPECRMIGLLRHPLDQVNSATRGGRYTPPGLEEFAVGGEDVRVSAARYWASRTERILDFAEANRERSVVVRYEDICDDPSGTLRPVFEFLGEQWEPDVLEFHRFEHDRGLEDGRVGVTRGFRRSTGGFADWPADVIARCEEVVGPVSHRAGYGRRPSTV